MRLPSTLVVALALAWIPAAAPADPPAMLADGGTQASRAELSFASFAGDWMSRARARGDHASRAPRARPGSAGLVFSYRAVDPDYRTELRPTGRPVSPYVGVLHYTELTYTCSDVRGSRCAVTSSLPLAEVFRYRDGRWGY
jgi:hypothetical protein